MLAYQVGLRFAPDRGPVRLRELTGFEERSVIDGSTASAIRLLDELLLPLEDGGLHRGQVGELPAADRDRLLVAVFQSAYGERVEGTVRCAKCDNLFDLSFSLPDLAASLEAGREQEGIEALPDGTFRLGDGRRFRLPAGRDECAIAGLHGEEAENALLDRCRVEGEVALDPAEFQRLAERIAPVLDLDLDAACPECGSTQRFGFDIQSYLLNAIIQERNRLTSEVHRLATAYGWGLGEILSLSRSERRTLVGLAETEMARRGRSWP